MTEDRDLQLFIPTGERLAVFFFRLGDSLGWPAGAPIRMSEPLTPALLQVLEAHEGSHIECGSEVLAASIIFHYVDEDVVTSSGLAATLAAFNVGFPRSKKPVPDRGEGLDAKVAVAEVVVPLVSSRAVAAASAGESHIDLPDLIDPPESLISDALDIALESVRSLQRSFVATTRRPTKLVARQLLPVIVPYGVRDGDKAPHEEGSTSGMFLVNDRFERIGAGFELSSEQQRKMLSVPMSSRHLMSYTDLYNQAAVALREDGNTRECAVMLGAASEVFLSLLVLFLRWESGVQPEVSAARWPDSLVSRIRTELPNLLGGSWALDGKGPAAAWYSSVYDLRNRAAHSGYEPTFDECVDAIGALNSLISYVGDRLTSGQRLKRFPRTATMIFGSRLESRLSRLPWLQELQNDPDEVDWMTVSGRWIDCHYRLVRDALVPRSPDTESSELLSVWQPGSVEPSAWVLRHRGTGMACEVQIDPVRVVLPTAPFESILEGMDQYPIVMGHARMPNDIVSAGPWVEEYHLDRLLGVMVDGSDAVVPWPVAPVRQE